MGLLGRILIVLSAMDIYIFRHKFDHLLVVGDLLISYRENRAVWGRGGWMLTGDGHLSKSGNFVGYYGVSKYKMSLHHRAMLCSTARHVSSDGGLQGGSQMPGLHSASPCTRSRTQY